MFAIIQTGGKQYKVSEGATLQVEKLPTASGKPVTFDHVLLVANGDQVTVGTPTVAGASVTAEVVSEGRDRKIVVRKFKAKVRYRRTHGHRQHYTEVKITGIKHEE
ncbi:MAG: 50S ribosomal protein L21 [Candidatus Kerfeldbacteria bacterium]|nr:50S ribosomal protein L21 [Candidatus Kerfeldbacteria bacterium]